MSCALDPAVPAADSGYAAVVATGNVGHLARYVAAEHWSAIVPYAATL